MSVMTRSVSPAFSASAISCFSLAMDSGVAVNISPSSSSSSSLSGGGAFFRAAGRRAGARLGGGSSSSSSSSSDESLRPRFGAAFPPARGLLGFLALAGSSSSSATSTPSGRAPVAPDLARSFCVLESVLSTSSAKAVASDLATKVSKASFISSSFMMFSLAPSPAFSSWSWTRSSMRTASSSPSSTGAASNAGCFSRCTFCFWKCRMESALATRPTNWEPNLALLTVPKPVWSTRSLTSTWSGSAMGCVMPSVAGSNAPALASSIKDSTLSASTWLTFCCCSRSSSSPRPSSSASAISPCAKGRTFESRCGLRRNSSPRICSRPQCLGRASPSTRDVATGEPGCVMRNVPTADSRGLIKDSCSWPQMTRSNHSGIMDSCTHVFLPRPTSRFWWSTKMEK
mmetsp:Transcript_1186/g.3565  ORF Transcript_1186/g.3565 Transcript_1186/m.3565 type:complete len:400 (-) Transcript_1186:782-1981(-)